MTRSTASSRGVLVAAALATGLLAAPSAAEASKVTVSGKSVRVGGNRVAAIKLTNPNGSTVRGRLTLVRKGKRVGRKGFRLRAGASKRVRVRVSRRAYRTLKKRRTLRVGARARARGRGTARRRITLRYRAGSGGGGAGWVDGRYQGGYAGNNVNLPFNVVAKRLFSGPFDSFFLSASCRNKDPGYTGPQVYSDSNAIGGVQARIAGGGAFSGSGTYQTGFVSFRWKVSGRISGKRVTGGVFSASYTDTFGNPCSGTTHFTAAWYGKYTL